MAQNVPTVPAVTEHFC